MLRTFLSAVFLLLFPALAFSQEAAPPDGKQSRETLKEPVFRISKARVESTTPKANANSLLETPQPAEHPLDPAIKMAREGLERIQLSLADYSCTVVKQERIDGELMPQEYMYAEIRNRKVENGRVVTPFSVYLYYLKPDKMKGREVIFVEGANENKLVGHEGSGLLRRMGAVPLDPRGKIAMHGNRYPITDIGVEFLVSELIKRGERDRQRGECTVEFKQGVKINGRPCTLLEVVHPQPRPYFDFNIARVYIDDELNLPVRYEAYTWPKVPGGQPELEECYTYLNIKVNVGLTDESFDTKRFRL